MTSIRFASLLVSGLAVLTLSACGEGWEMVPYEGTPYGDRTAGYGVAYVRSHMLPEKGPKLEPVMPAPEPVAEPMPEPEPEPAPIVTEQETKIEDAEPMFEAEITGKK